MLRQATRRLVSRAHQSTSPSFWNTPTRPVHSTTRTSKAAAGAEVTKSSTSPNEMDALVAAPGDGPNHRSVMALDGNSIRPHVQVNAFVAPSASVIGSVVINDKAMVSYGSIIRGDLALIHIGFCSIVGENCVITAGEVVNSERKTEDVTSSTEGETVGRNSSSKSMSPADAVAAGLSIEPELVVGDFCDIGANSNLHSCVLEGDNVVGHGCVLEQGVRMGRFSEVLPNSVLKAGAHVGSGEIWGGNPAVKVSQPHPDDNVPKRQKMMAAFSNTYDHMYEFLPVGTVYLEKEAIEESRS